MSLTVFPTLTFNSGGSDGNSGSAPATALTGTAAATCLTTNTVVGFFEGTPPDLSTVPTDGSAVVRVTTASGRQFSRISAVQNTTQVSTTVSGTLGSAATSVTVVAGANIATGDIIKITGAGAASADLYTKVTAGGGTNTLTIADATGTSTTNTAVVRPKCVTTEDNMTAAQVTKAWGIGGKLLNFNGTNGAHAFADAKGGWTIQTDNTQSLTGALAMSGGGDTTNGPVVVQSTTGSQIVTSSAAAANSFSITADYWLIQNLTFQNTSGAKTAGAAVSFSGHGTIRNCILGDVTNTVFNGLTCSSKNVRVQDCEFRQPQNNGIVSASGPNLRVWNTWIHGHGAAAISMTGTSLVADIRDCIIAKGTASGIVKSGGTGLSQITVANCTIDGNTGASSDGIDISGAAIDSAQIVIVNNQITNNGRYGINGNAATDALKALIDANNFSGNGTAARNNVTAGANDIAVAPAYTATASNNYLPGSASNGKGYPLSTRTVGANQSGSTSNVTIGAVQPTASGAVAGGSSLF